MNVNTKFENVFFLKKSKIFSDRDEQRIKKIQNNMKSTTGYLE